MKSISFYFWWILFAVSIVGCTSNEHNAKVQQYLNTQIDMLHSEIDSLKSELSLYKEKYGELKTLNPKKKEFGVWTTSYYVDDFGEPTKDGYSTTYCFGSFSNSATTNADLSVRFLIDKSSIRIQLYEYAGNHPIKGEGFLRFKAKRFDEVLDFKTYNSDNGNNTVLDEYYKPLLTLLQKGGEIKFVAQTSSSYSLSEYKFTLSDASYIKEALQSLGD